MKALLDEIMKNNILGTCVAFLSVVEFQKRGLPRVHILVYIAAVDKVVTSDDVDNAICAEIPHERSRPNLYAAVKTHIIHGPCGKINPSSVCMDKQKNICARNFS